ncbi:XRE family transcriptional regulator [Actinomadura fulvescens]|uniref:XRE family transcriptional regulator n=1 Tax=Actinomadura fulvescens TaxID=46160 RepID=A0ABP6D7S1_9ACTN
MDVFSTGLQVDALGPRIRGARQAAGLSLDDLAARSGVSRSMLSDVERGAKLPSILVLDRIASGLGAPIGRLLGQREADPVAVLRREDVRTSRDEDGWEWRLLSPPLEDHGLQVVRVTAPPGTRVAEFSPHAPGSREWVTVERGTLTVTVGGTGHELADGEAISYPGDRPHAFANVSTDPCEYFLVMDIKPWLPGNPHIV